MGPVAFVELSVLLRLSIHTHEDMRLNNEERETGKNTRCSAAENHYFGQEKQ